MTAQRSRPASVDDAADAMRELSAAGAAVRPCGAGTKLDWGGSPDTSAVPLSTAGLDRIVEHNPGDFTATLQAGVPLAAAQRAFAEAGQWLALDPPSARDAASGGASSHQTPNTVAPGGGHAEGGGGATVGGVMATGDSGPARHRYGGVRDLVIGVTVVLSDGTVASAGGKVIKNVAGYDLGKLFAGSYGTLGLIASVTVRLHPRPVLSATAVATTGDPDRLAAAALALSGRPLGAECLDAGWHAGTGRLMVRFTGVTAADQARQAAELLDGLDDVELLTSDGRPANDAPATGSPAGGDATAGGDVTATAGGEEAVWAAQRAGQRSRDGAVVKVSGLPTDLAAVVRAADAAGAGVVSRAGLGLSWLAFAPGDDLARRVADVRRALHPRATVVLDGGDRVAEPWPAVAPGALAVMQRIKARFDPTRTLRPGAYVGGI